MAWRDSGSVVGWGMQLYLLGGARFLRRMLPATFFAATRRLGGARPVSLSKQYWRHPPRTVHTYIDTCHKQKVYNRAPNRYLLRRHNKTKNDGARDYTRHITVLNGM